MPSPPFADPFAWFDAWFEEASQQVAPDPNAMTLATVSPDGRPAVRVVLLKSWDEHGFVFYTNRRSRKGLHLTDHPVAALNFYWRELGRQIRIEGDVELVSNAESDAYFASRPRLAQVGAWASLQSETLDDRAAFDARVAEIEARYDGRDIPRPPHWGGYRVIPQMLEFWRSGEYRWHERWEFRRVRGSWTARMLFP